MIREHVLNSREHAQICPEVRGITDFPAVKYFSGAALNALIQCLSQCQLTGRDASTMIKKLDRDEPK